MPGIFVKINNTFESRNKYEKKERTKYFRYLWIFCQYFLSDKYYSYYQVLNFTNYSYSYLYGSWLRKFIPYPICNTNNHSWNTALHCDVLHCTTLNYTAPHCTFLRCIALHSLCHSYKFNSKPGSSMVWRLIPSSVTKINRN